MCVPGSSRPGFRLHRIASSAAGTGFSAVMGPAHACPQTNQRPTSNPSSAGRSSCHHARILPRSPSNNNDGRHLPQDAARHQLSDGNFQRLGARRDDCASCFIHRGKIIRGNTVRCGVESPRLNRGRPGPRPILPAPRSASIRPYRARVTFPSPSAGASPLS